VILRLVPAEEALFLDDVAWLTDAVVPVILAPVKFNIPLKVALLIFVPVGNTIKKVSLALTVSTRLIENRRDTFLLTTIGVVDGLGPMLIVKTLGCSPVTGAVQVSIK
jgi:hypothetical protein